MRLRDYQENGITLLRKSYSKQKKEGVERNNSLLVVGTGGGKTLTTTALFKSAIDKGSRCLFLTNRISLVLQTIRVFMENDLDPSVCWAGNPNGFIPSPNSTCPIISPWNSANPTCLYSLSLSFMACPPLLRWLRGQP